MNLKQKAGEKAIDFIEDGMILGLGTGSTVYFTIRKIGERVKEGLKIKTVCTSRATEDLAREFSIPFYPLDELSHIDLTIDGADEVDRLGNGIKGGGGALLFEKIVSSNSTQNIWVIEDRKKVDKLGAFPLPVEVLPFGHKHVLAKLENLNYRPVLRMQGDEVYRTDSNNYIFDLHLGEIQDPYHLDQELKKIPGVIEHGLFLDTVNRVIVAGEGGDEVITYR